MESSSEETEETNVNVQNEDENISKIPDFSSLNQVCSKYLSEVELRNFAASVGLDVQNLNPDIPIFQQTVSKIVSDTVRTFLEQKLEKCSTNSRKSVSFASEPQVLPIPILKKTNETNGEIGTSSGMVTRRSSRMSEKDQVVARPVTKKSPSTRRSSVRNRSGSSSSDEENHEKNSRSGTNSSRSRSTNSSRSNQRSRKRTPSPKNKSPPRGRGRRRKN